MTTSQPEQKTPQGAPPSTAAEPRRGRARLRAATADPLFRNGYALMANTAISAMLGLGYWWLAAACYTREAVGQGSAAIAAMKLLSSITALGLTGALARFTLQAGKDTRRVVRRVYLVNAVASTAIGLVFLLGLPLWGSHYAFLADPWAGAVFLLAVLAWSWLTLQDGVMIGLRAAAWVPVGNVIFSLGKIALLTTLASVIPLTGVFVSWTAATALSVVPLGWLVFRRLVPRRVAEADPNLEPPSYRQIGRFLAGDYTGSLFNLIVTYFVPVLVVARVSAEQNAVFYIINTIGGTLDILAVNMASSLTVESAHSPATLAENTRASLQRMAYITLPCAVVMFAGAPEILGAFGSGYARHGVALLRWLALAAFTRVVIELYFGALRARGRTRQVAVLQGVLCVLVLGGSLLFIPHLGIAGVGVAELISQSLVAVCALAGLLHVMRGHQTPATPRPLGHWPRPPSSAVLGLLGAACLAAYLHAMHTVTAARLDAMGGLGLVSVLPTTALAAVAGIGMLFVLALRQHRPSTPLLLFLLLATVLCLHGAAALTEDVPRFPTAWQHLGFVDYISRTGQTLPDWDARFSWPGFFALAAFLGQAGGMHDLLPVLRWSQVGSQLLCLAALAVILRNFDIGRRCYWCALWFFSIGSWVGQDYFSPQGYTYALYLFFLAVLLTWFRRGGGSGTGELPARRTSAGERSTLLLVLLSTFTAALVSHQLTPFVMIAAALLLWLIRRSSLSIWFPILMSVLTAAMISFMAQPFWSGHMDVLFGGIGHVGGNISNGVAGRVKGDASHQTVLYVRVLLSSAWFALAAAGLRRRRRRGARDRVLPMIACLPFFALGLQSYGGEIALRVFLFALPGVCALAACAFFPATSRKQEQHPPGRPATAAFLLWTLISLAAFGVARYGNESFERVTSGEVAAMQWVYTHDTPSARLLYLGPDTAPNTTPAIPWNQRDMERITYTGVAAPRDPRAARGVEQALAAAGPQSYLLVSSSEGADLEINDGYSPGWYRQFRDALDHDPRLRAVVSISDASVYAPAVPASDPVPVDIGVGRPGPLVSWTPWTPIGLTLLAGVAPLLFLREPFLLRVRGAGRTEPLHRRPAALFAVVAGVMTLGFLAVVLERFAALR